MRAGRTSRCRRLRSAKRMRLMQRAFLTKSRREVPPILLPPFWLGPVGAARPCGRASLAVQARRAVNLTLAFLLLSAAFFLCSALVVGALGTTDLTRAWERGAEPPTPRASGA